MRKLKRELKILNRINSFFFLRFHCILNFIVWRLMQNYLGINFDPTGRCVPISEAILLGEFE